MGEGQCLWTGKGGEGGMKKELGALGQGEVARGSGHRLYLETLFPLCKLKEKEKGKNQKLK